MVVTKERLRQAMNMNKVVMYEPRREWKITMFAVFFEILQNVLPYILAGRLYGVKRCKLSNWSDQAFKKYFVFVTGVYAKTGY